MALERRNPLPPGRYWIDVFGDNRARFTAWRAQHAAKLEVISSESFDTSPPRDWYLFYALEPVPFDAKVFGFPTIAHGDIGSSADTVQRPPPEPDVSPLEPLTELGRTVQMLAVVAGGIALLPLLSRLFKKK